MKRDFDLGFRRIWPATGLLVVALAPSQLLAGPPQAASAAFDSYIGGVESRLTGEQASASGFLAMPDPVRLRQGEPVIEERTPAGGKDLGGALLHDWRGTAFAPGANVANFERVMKDFGAYPKVFAPQIVRARVLGQQGDRYEVTMRVRQRHIVAVVMDTTYDVKFAREEMRGGGIDRGDSISRSTSVAEIDAAGTARERALGPSEDHGFLWRMNTYWAYEERDGGLYIRVESVSLTRSVPVGLGWAVAPFIESIPRDALEFTLRSACRALRR